MKVQLAGPLRFEVIETLSGSEHTHQKNKISIT
jgi:hypothetical protein